MNWQLFLQDHNIQYEHKEAKVVCNCPIHTPKDVDKFLALFPSGAGSCWYCGGHSPIDLIQAFLHIDSPQAKTIYMEYSKSKSYYTIPERVSPLAIQLPGILFNKFEEAYLTKRGVTEEQRLLYDMRSGGATGYFSHRIVLPVHNEKCEIVSARGRAINKTPIKYKALDKVDEIIPHKHLLYGEHLVIGSSIAVVEGEFDAIAGGPGFVATFGTSVTPEQIHRLLKYKRVYLCFDGDLAGRQAMERISNAIAMLAGDSVEVYEVVLQSTKKDMAEHDVDELVSIRKGIFS